MTDPQGIEFENHDGIALCRIAGVYGMAEGVHTIRDMVALANERHISRLMIVVTETSGYGIPSLSMRLAMMREWADAAGGFVRVVVICRPELIDPNKFGITMAANYGMRAEVFSTEEEGLAWLRQLDNQQA